MKPGELLLLADEIRADRLEGTQSHWWRERIGDFALDENMGQYGGQDAADKRRILRTAYLETAFLHLMEQGATEAGIIEAGGKMRLALAGFVSPQSAIDAWDAVAEGNKE